MTPETLRAFSAEIAEEFNSAKIPHPVHLSDGNEEQLIEIFRDVGPYDWVCGSWRMHYQCLLKGVTREELKAAIRRGESIALCFPEHRIVNSAIVGGVLPIAVGIAMGIQRRGGTERVWCFLGDMTATTGIAHECMFYAGAHDLPIRFVIEDNAHSVCTPTAEVWAMGYTGIMKAPDVVRYEYKSKFPHAGAGVRVQF